MIKLLEVLEVLKYERDNDPEIMFEHDVAIRDIELLIVAIKNLNFWKRQNAKRSIIKRSQKHIGKRYIKIVNEISQLYWV